MKLDEIKVGGYYVMQGGGIIRHVYDMTSMGKVWYRAYDMHSGDYIHTSHCDIGFLVNQAKRKAAPEEIRRLHETKYREVGEGHRRRPLREALRSAKV